MKIYIQIVGTETGDSTPSFLVHLETTAGNFRVLINCGEGTQRFCVQHQLRLGKFSHILLTRLKWEQLGGLPGAILTIADSRAATERAAKAASDVKGKKEKGAKGDGRKPVDSAPLYLFGPLNTAFFLESTRYYINRDNFTFQITEFIDNTPTQLSDMKVTPVVISLHADDTFKTVSLNAQQQHESQRVTSMLLDSKLSLDSRPHYKNVPPMKYVGSNPSAAKTDDIVVCYVLTTPDIPGKFDAKKAKELGVKPGPEFGKLSKGETITLENGNVVKPSDVIPPNVPGSIVIVIHCPTMAHLPLIVSSPVLKSYHNLSTVSMVIHITPTAILNDPTYAQFMFGFHASTEVCLTLFSLLGDCPQSLVFTNWSRNQFMFNELEPRIFPLPFYTETPKALALPENIKIKFASPLQIFHLAPANQAGYEKGSALPPFSVNVFENKLPLKEKISTFTSEIKHVRTTQSQDDTQITFLGTGAALPSKYRNVTAHFVHIPKFGNLMLDAGEGSFGQLYRRFGPELLKQHLTDLKLIFISHIHADHHLGLIRILNQRQKVFEESDTPAPTIYVIAPAWVYNWLTEFSALEKLDFVFIDCQHLTTTDHPHSQIFSSSLGITQFQTVLVDHCPEAFGVAISHASGWKLVFSGDTRPCQRLAEIGQGATLLIHEATFEDSKSEDAVKKAHSTTGEAISIGKAMNAEFVMLNHFSQRYPTMPTFSESSFESDVRLAGIAFDLMSITFSDISFLPYLYHPMKSICEEISKEEGPLDTEKEQDKKVN